MNPPNLADYLGFLRGVVGLPASYLGLANNNVIDAATGAVIDSAFAQVTSNPLISQFQLSLNIALDIVNDQLNFASPDIYTLAVYNLAADRLINFGMDPQGQTVFADARKSYNVFNSQLGIVVSASDNGTSSAWEVPDFIKNMTLQNLQMLKTPWGRTYLGFAEAVGTNWGLS